MSKNTEVTEYQRARHKLSDLRLSAERVTKKRGHILQWGKVVWTRQEYGKQRGICRTCGESVDIDTHPPANGIDIGGSALAVECHID